MTGIEKIYEELKQMETDDYQNRDGDYPKSNIPVSIEVSDNVHNVVEVMATFKNTDEETSIKWVKRNLPGYNIKNIAAYQDGDYHDDWVQVYALIVE